MRSFTAHITTILMSFACLLACGLAQAQTAPPEEQPPLRGVQAPVPQEVPVKSDPRYRVELLVFRHLNANEEGFTETALRDFSEALDLLTPPEPSADGDEPEKPVAPSVPHAAGTSPTTGGEVAEAEEPEPAVELVDMQSEAMQHAWRRLRASAGFRPEQFLAWEQSTAKPFPLIRVHDLEVLKELDALSGLPMDEATGPENSGEAVVYNDTTKRPYDKAVGGEADGTASLPQTIRFYRIDGSARLRRSRFLHLELDIEFREPLSASMAVPATEYPESPVVAAETSGPTYVVHKLSQSRQVQTTNYEYFDGPTFAVLALVTRIDALSAEEQLAEEALATEVEEIQN